MMDVDKFEGVKCRTWVQDGGVYQPGNPFADKSGRLELDPLIVDAVLDINRDRSAFTGPTCQGHFCVPRDTSDISPYGEVYLDFDGEGNLVAHLSGSSSFLFSEMYPDRDLDSLLFKYAPGRIVIGVKDDDHGNAFHRALEDWARRQNGDVSFGTNGNGMCVATFVSEEVSALSKERQYTYAEILELNAARSRHISDLQASVRGVLDALPDGAPEWLSSSIKIDLERKGRIPPDVLPGSFSYDSKSEPIKLSIEVHYHDNGKIVIHHPGWTERADGYKGKYRTLGNFLVKKDVAAVIRLDNEERDYHPYGDTLCDDLRFVIEYAIKNSKEICGSDSPTIYLMGFSGGATSSATIAHEFPQVEKILLMGPAYPSKRCIPEIKEGLSKFTGDVYVVQGEQDHYGRGHLFHSSATAASRRELVYVPDCEHFFQHERNDKIYSKAPLWAFAGDTTFPSPEGGVRLVNNFRFTGGRR